MKIPIAYLAIIEPMIVHARGLLEGGDQLSTLAFVGNFQTGQIVPVVLDDRSNESKDASAALVGRTASMLDADFVFIIREAWKLPQKYITRYEEIMDTYGSIGASPFAQDIAAFSLETTHGTWVASPLIKPKPPSKKRRTFGVVNFEHVPELKGRFSGLLTKKIDGGGVLH